MQTFQGEAGRALVFATHTVRKMARHCQCNTVPGFGVLVVSMSTTKSDVPMLQVLAGCVVLKFRYSSD